MRSILFLLLTFISLSSIGSEKDSLRKVWENPANDDSGRMEALHMLNSIYYAQYAVDSALVLADLLYDLAESKGNKLYMSQALGLKGTHYFYKDDYERATENMLKSLEYLDQAENRYLRVYALNNLGTIYYRQEKYSESIEYIYKSLTLCEELKDTATIAANYSTLAANYGDQKEYDKSNEFLEKAIEINRTLNDSLRIVINMSNIANNYSILKNHTKANEIFLEALDYSLRIHSKYDQAFIYTGLAANYVDWAKSLKLQESEQQLKWLFKALNYYTKSAALFTEFGAEDGILQARLGIGQSYAAFAEYYKSKKETKKAQRYFLVANDSLEAVLEDIANFSNAKLHMEATNSAYRIQKALGKKEEALATYELYISLKDSIFNQEEQKKLLRQEYEYAYEKEALQDSLAFVNEKAISDLKIVNQEATIDRQRYVLIGSGIILTLLAVLSLVFFFSRKRIQKDKLMLENLNREKDGMINIVAHDLQAPLSNAHSILEIKMLEKAEGEDKEVLEECQREIDYVVEMIADILDSQLLELGHVLSKTKEVELSSTLDQLLDRFKRSAMKKSIQFIASELEGLYVNADPKMLIRIIENLLSNAFKFSPKGSKVELKSQVTDSFLQLSIIDEGEGFSEQDKKMMYRRFQRLSAKPTSGENSFGLGLSIVKSLSDQMGIDLLLESEKGKGSKFTLQFQLPKKSA